MATDIETALERLKKLPFPEFAESDILADWQAELVELDGHIVGAATTILSGGKANLTGISEAVARLRQQLEMITDISPQDYEIMAKSKQYIEALEDVVKSIKHLTAR